MINIFIILVSFIQQVTAKRTNRPGISSTNRRPRGGRGGYGGFRGSSPGGYYTPSRPKGRFG